jgi:hypothetical protein
MWEVEYTDEFGAWWEHLTEAEKISVTTHVELLEHYGPNLPFPYSSGIYGSKYPHMRELRVQHQGKPIRVIYAFDPRRIAILLVGGNKIGNSLWYTKFIALADKLYDAHLKDLS